MVMTDTRRWATLAVLCLSLLVVSLDMLILNVAVPVIVDSMHATSSQLQWVVDAYVVVYAGLLLVIGSIGDRFGRKLVYLSGLVVFAAGSTASAFSNTPDHLIAARAFMGIGGAAIMPSTLSILTNVFTKPAERSRAIGIWSGTTGLGLAFGPMAGGWLLDHFWWGSVFLINVPITLFALVIGVVIVPNSTGARPPRTDVVGSLLSICGMGLLLWSIIEAPNRGWTSGWILGGLGGAVVGLVAFGLWERRSSNAMLELSLFRSRRFSAAIGAMAVVIFALMGALFLLTQYLQFSLGYTPLQTGWRILPIAAVLLVCAPLSMVLVRVVGTKPVVFTGMALIGAGMALLTTATVTTRYADVLPWLFLLGIGAGLAFAPCTDAVMGSLRPEQTGVGSATNGAVLQTGGALGVGVLGSLLNARYQGRMTPVLSRYAIPPSVFHLVTGSLGGTLAMSRQIGGRLGAALAQLGKEAFVGGMDLALMVGACATAVAALVVIGVLPNRPPPDLHEEGRVDPSGLGSAAAGRCREIGAKTRRSARF
jgi:EmrB/QacA subfamily drug resistance transporter